MYGTQPVSSSPVLTADGTTQLTEKYQKFELLADHFDAVLNNSSHIVKKAINRLPQIDVKEDLETPPTLSDIFKAINQLLNGKAPGHLYSTQFHDGMQVCVLDGDQSAPFPVTNEVKVRLRAYPNTIQHDVFCNADRCLSGHRCWHTQQVQDGWQAVQPAPLLGQDQGPCIKITSCPCDYALNGENACNMQDSLELFSTTCTLDTLKASMKDFGIDPSSWVDLAVTNVATLSEQLRTGTSEREKKELQATFK